MMHIDIDTLASVTAAQLVTRGTLVITSGVVTDTRQLSEGCLFVALSGARFNGNHFAAQAAQQGAAAVIVSEDIEPISAGCSVLKVEDTLLALQALANWWRSQLNPRCVIGLTGSSGKTSTKDMLLAILSQSFRSKATLGNLNNHIGVPLSILSTPADTECCIWEMGMNHAGEIAPLCAMARPHMGIITHIGTAHIEYLGSRDAIAAEKATLVESLPAEGWSIFPAAEEYADFLAERSKAQSLAVGGENSSVRAENINYLATATEYTLHIDGLGSCPIYLPIPGQHMVSNSLLAIAAAWKAGCSLEDMSSGLRELSITHGRLHCREQDGYYIIDDSYNANLESMIAALETVAAMKAPRRRIAVLGLMGELGEHGAELHAALGRRLVQLGFDILLTVADDCANRQALHQAAEGVRLYSCSSHDEAAQCLRNIIQEGDALLFKGSRSAAMERVLQQIFPPAPSES